MNLLERAQKLGTPKFAKEKLEKICVRFHNVFHLDGEPISANNFYKRVIKMSDNLTSYIKNYRIPGAQKTKIEKQVKVMLDGKIIEKSVSPYNSPLLVVPKKGGASRVVVDFRNVNKKVMADKFPLPRIDEILDQFGRAKYFSVLDLKSGFHQIEIEKKSREITAFSTNSGHF
jgi:Reverse transcriptase (RNA-dependent DNA polymerase)